MGKKFTVRLAGRVLLCVILSALFSTCGLGSPGAEVLAVKVHTYSKNFLKGGMAHFFAEVIGVYDQSVEWTVLDDDGEELENEELKKLELRWDYAPQGNKSSLRRGEVFLHIPKDYEHNNITVKATYANARLVDDPRNFGKATISLVSSDKIPKSPPTMKIITVIRGVFRNKSSQFEAEVNWGNDGKPDVDDAIDLDALVWHIVAGNTNGTNIDQKEGTLNVNKSQRVGARLSITATLIHFGVSDTIHVIVYPDFSIEIIPPKNGVSRGSSQQLEILTLNSSATDQRQSAVRWSIMNVGYDQDQDGNVTSWGDRPAKAHIDKDGVLTVSDREAGGEYDPVTNNGYLWVEAASWEYPDITSKPTKILISGLAPKTEGDFRFVSAGVRNTMALDLDGYLWAWGTGPGVNSPKPDRVYTVTTKFVSISSGGEPSTPYALAIAEDGTLWAWGNNEWGKTGLGITTSQPTLQPQQVGTSDQWVHVSAGKEHSLGIQRDGTLWAWGRGMYAGSGTNAPSNIIAPTRVGDSTNWMFAEAGLRHSVAVQKDGTLWAWGSNKEYQVNPDTTIFFVYYPTLLRIPGSNVRMSSVLAGDDLSAAIDENGALWMWGDNVSSVPKKILSPNVVLRSASMYATGKHILAIDTENNVRGLYTGTNEGLLGSSNANASPLQLYYIGTNHFSVSAGKEHSMLLGLDYKLMGAGKNTAGEVGVGHTNKQESFASISK